MKKLSTFLISVLFTCTAYAQATHPLDPLDQNEIKTTLEVLKKEGKSNSDILFPNLVLQEPPKSEILAFKPGQKFRREAAVVLFNKKTNQTFEAIVDLISKKSLSYKEVQHVQPGVLLSEFDTMPPIVKADPDWQQAMRRRGITNFDDVAIDIWAYGTPDSERTERVRLLRAVSYFKGKGKNFYARPIEGVTAIVNVSEGKVEKVFDTGVLPIPTQHSELDEKSLGPARKGLKPLKISMPQGPSYQLNGNEVIWQNWHFRFSMHPREGLVLHTVQYEDHGKLRSVLYRGSLSDMMVPYGHNDSQWTWRSAFDEGEYGIGRYSGSLIPGSDVPENAKFFDATFVDDFGKPSVVKRAVALYERDGGILWKHFDMYNGLNESRRSRELVIGFITTVSNYDYGMNWIFHQDGTLELDAELTGIMLPKGSKLEKMTDHNHDDPDLAFAHVVAPFVVAPHHQHFFNFRLDLDVDGPGNNSALELNAKPLPPGKENPSLNAFVMEHTPLKSEKEAQRDLSFEAQRKWEVVNTSVTNSLGYHPGYILIPSETSAPFLNEKSPLRTRGGFVNHAVWFTQFDENEKYAAGFYPNQRRESDGLPEWTKKNRSLEGQDVVLWYTFGITHAPRPEEWPVMPVTRTGFKLVPAGFFEKNPALDVPKSAK